MSVVKSHSLIRQTVLVVTAAQLLGALLFCGGALLHERHARQRALDAGIQGHSDSLLGAIQDAEDPDDTVTIDALELQPSRDDVYAVYNQNAALIGRSPQAPAALIERRSDGFREARVGGVRYRVLERQAMRIIDRLENNGVGLKRPVTILYASPEDHLWHETFEGVRFYLLAIALATGVTMFLVALLLRKSLQPLDELAAATAQLSPPALAFEAPASVLRVRELRPLAEVLTSSVSRLRAAFAKEQQFLGDAAHELKTAIAVVRSSVQLLMLRRRTVDEYAAGLERVLEDNSRVEALVTQMLQLARTDEPAAVDVPLIDLHALASSALEHLRPVMEERNVCVNLPASTPMKVRLMRERGLTLISNLLMNAVQHSFPGQSVSVAFRRAEDAVVMEIADVGSGISAEALPHIFERFYREDRSRSRDTGGTGLGLSICKSVVETAGGHISVESAPGRGTRITVTFTAV
ncbi:MAG: sensor histidine kinase [Janthinobacterium lividum]